MIQTTERELTKKERLQLERSGRSHRRRVTKARSRVLIACGVIVTLLCCLTLIVSKNQPVMVVTFWLMAGCILTALSLNDINNEASSSEALIHSMLRKNQVTETRIVSARTVEIKEIEDEGPCFAFEGDPDTIVFVSGQDFYHTKHFPNSDFTMRIINSEKKDQGEFKIFCHGHRITPERVISLDKTKFDARPEHLEVCLGTLDNLETMLTAPRAAAKQPCA